MVCGIFCVVYFWRGILVVGILCVVYFGGCPQGLAVPSRSTQSLMVNVRSMCGLCLQSSLTPCVESAKKFDKRWGRLSLQKSEWDF